jgi:hypothetical protein
MEFFLNIFIDESGSFAHDVNHGKWSTVVAYVSPEIERIKTRDILHRLKKNSGYSINDEVKLGSVEEGTYLEFLEHLNKLEGVVFCSATDAGLNTLKALKFQKEKQAKEILCNKDKMIDERGKDNIELFAQQVVNLADQLYLQLHCQIYLIQDLITLGIPYFIQRKPNSLKSFRWRIDQKNSSKNYNDSYTQTDYEYAFETLCPVLLQTRSFLSPFPMLDWVDYSPLKNYMYDKSNVPSYLKEQYGLEIDMGLNIGKILQDNIKFEDSKKSVGIQIADLLASGFRRCLRNGFQDNNAVSILLGKLLIQNEKGKLPIHILGFGNKYVVDDLPEKIIKTFHKNCRRMQT